ncbi:nuclease-related domain-containing protein [Arthrobacter celericrescens]|uniref:nuclease-related domain-containing protein n=1 Tax=Arthrobacter celericrescens TaxID=2320851 RepID=UPI001FDF7EAD|nr:nuclease-related domain-containing protein [Arthrobacter celericrescens]
MSLQEPVPAQTAIGRILGRSPLTAEARSWYQGATAEIAVGKILSGLGPEWTVLHAVPVGSGSSDIDHVVIGPGGIFTLNTKNHSGQSVWVAGRTLMVSGSKTRHIPNSAYEAQRASKLLGSANGTPVSATGVVVICGAKTLTIKEWPADVVVLSSQRLANWLRRQPQRLTVSESEQIAAVAANPRTWHRHPQAEHDPGALQARFSALQREVQRAALIRAAWVLAAACLFVAVILNFRF